MSTPRIPVPFDDVFTSADLGRFGLTSGALQGWRARDEVIELNPGVYVAAGTGDIETLRAVFASRAIALGRRPLTVAGAALFHELASPSPQRTEWSRDDRHRQVPAQHVAQVGRLLVPSAAWTAVELARSQPLEQALIPFDAALARGCSREALAQCVQDAQGGRGTRLLVSALAAADARAESPFESLSRGLMHVAGLPAPSLQQEFRTPVGAFRVDFWWPEARVIGEADGRLKYTDQDVLWKEKRRQEALERLGVRVVRWTWDDVTARRVAWLRRLRGLLAPSPAVS